MARPTTVPSEPSGARTHLQDVGSGMMYGQMTAGSWIYIGTQGILQGTYETFAASARAHFGGTLKRQPTLTVTAGLGGMGGAQPLAATMNGGVVLASRSTPSRIDPRIETRYVDERPTTSTPAIDKAIAGPPRRGRKSIGVPATPPTCSTG